MGITISNYPPVRYGLSDITLMRWGERLRVQFICWKLEINFEWTAELL